MFLATAQQNLPSAPVNQPQLLTVCTQAWTQETASRRPGADRQCVQDDWKYFPGQKKLLYVHYLCLSNCCLANEN